MRKTMTFFAAAMLTLLPVLPVGADASPAQCGVRAVDQAVQAATDADGMMTLQTKGGPITFHVDMPDVEAVPVLRVAYATQADFPQKGPEGTKAMPWPTMEREDGWRVLMGAEEEIIGGEVREHTYRFRSEDESLIPEGSPMNHEEASRFFEAWLKAYAAPKGWEFRVDPPTANSRSYKAADYGQGFVPFLDQPITGAGHETGFYELSATQMLRGIPYWHHALDVSLSARERCISPVGEAYGWLLSPEHYEFFMAPIVETGVVAEDIPLAPFSAVLHALEGTSAPRGDTLMFGYTLRYDPEAPMTSAWTLPVWVYTTYAFNFEQIYINAQTGEIFDPTRVDVKLTQW